MGRLTFLKFPSAGSTTLLIFILLIVSFLLFIILAGLIKSYLQEKKLKNSFIREALERGLTEEEAEILWTYSRKLGRDPFLTLEFKAPFEKVVDLYLRTDPEAKEELVTEMRKKLGFDYVPYFVPLTCSKDIELFQPAKLFLPGDRKVDAALFDKDEKFMYWAILDDVPVPPTIIGETVKIQFIRKGDGIYTLEGKVVDVIRENTKTVLKIPHTFELSRYQRREYARVEVEIPASLGIYDKREDKIVWIQAEIVDISAGGVKVCVPLSTLNKEIPQMTEVLINFTLNNRRLTLKGTIVNFYPRRSTNCYGIKFEDIKPDVQKFIHDFVKKEQQRLAQLMIKNRG
jgi:c-di-GMP-binding flagellar brake protein YcgR